MKVKWLFQDQQHHDADGAARLAESAKRRHGDDVEFVKYVPFAAEAVGEDPLSLVAKEDKPVVVHGCINFVKKAQRVIASLAPSFSWQDYECTSYYPVYHEHLAQRTWAMMPFGSLVPSASRVYYEYGDSPNAQDNSVFFRPNSGTKIFDGQVVSRDKFSSWWNYLKDFRSVARRELVVVSRIESFSHEWRLLMKKHWCVTGSRYKVDGEMDVAEDVPVEVREFAESLARHYPYDRLYYLDIAKSVRGQLRLLEVSAFSVAGLYACNVDSVADAAHYSAVEEFNE